MYTGVPLFLNGNWMRRGAVHDTIAAHPFLRRTRTAQKCRSFSVGDRFPATWLADQEKCPSPASSTTSRRPPSRTQFIPAEPAELELSVVELADGESALAVARRRDVLGPDLVDISGFGGWRDNRLPQHDSR